ncbi:MAG: aminopeptidase N [Candidatus Puniceispirillales bacterium]
MPNSPVFRKDYAAPAHAVDKVDLTIAIYDDRAVVTARLETRQLARKNTPLVLKGGPGMQLDAISVDGSALNPDDLDPSSGEISVPVGKQSVVETVTTINPYENTTLEGLYLSGDMLCTQCEPEGFRHITWHPDRPDVMGVYTTRIEAPKRFPVLLANGNCIDKGDLGADRHFVTWHDPYPKPSYLFAMVAGDLEEASDSFTTMDGRQVALKIFVEHGNAHRTGHAMESLKKSMKWDEEVYGLAYDLDIFMIVAVSHFNMGAMENKGLNIFNSKFILADDETASDDDLERVEGIVAHEYFHNWTGNRITCRDWFQLTLKEGLTVYRDQEFTADMHSRGVKRADDVALLRAIQFPEDSGPTAHPIRPEEYSEINNFYTPTVYEKGAEVIRMIAAILGHDGFMKGMKRYVERHDGAAVTCEDFIAAMEDANNADLGQFRRWYEQAGTPRLRIDRSHDLASGELTLHLRQTLPETAAETPRKPLVMPISLGLVGEDGADLPVRIKGRNHADDDHQATVILDQHEAHITLTDVPEGAVPSYLRGFSAPVILDDDLTTADRLTLLAGDSDAFGRWDAGQSLMLNTLKAIIDGADHRDEGLDSLGRGIAAMLADDRLDGAEKARILKLPSQSIMEGMLETPDPLVVFDARDRMLTALAGHLAPLTEAGLAAFQGREDELTAQERALYARFIILAVKAGSDDAQHHALAMSRSRNMTISEAGLAALNQTDGAIRAEALADFAERWAENSLVMEKWFALESSAPLVSTPAHCETLMEHPAFDSNNPNKLRSVLSVFGMINTRHFHADDGSGYRFLARHIGQIDARNPQIAARMALPLTRFGRYGDDRQALIKGALANLKTLENISSDLSEVIGKALKQ